MTKAEHPVGRALAAPPGISPVSHLYVHLPFCRARCSYCDFSSEVIGPHERSGSLAAYMDAVGQEIALVGKILRHPVETLYVGGGTPSAVPHEYLRALFLRLEAVIGPRTEVTIEANPETLDDASLGLFARHGVTRLSLGVQSFDAGLLAALGRKTAPGAAEAAVESIRRNGWEEWSLDLVFGIPGQSLETLEADMAAAVAARPPHISVYDLTYTRRYARRVESRLGSGARPAAEEFADAHYAMVHERLAACGYERYEISNYRLPGHGSRHNLAYWRGEDYVGVGAASVSTVGGLRWTHPAEVAGYLAAEPPTIEVLSDEVRRFERVMLGMRTSEGVADAIVRSAADEDALDRLLAEGLIERRYATLRLSPRGLDLGNAGLAAILRSPEEAPPAPGGPNSAWSGPEADREPR